MDTQFSSGPRRQSSHHLQPLTSLGYIPQQAIQSYDYNTYRMYSLNPNISNLEQDPLLNHNHSMEAIHHEAMQRQLEKQKIREEIIQAENKRRRMLEAEVRRELMMERQMLLQHHGYTAEERPLDGYTSDYRPFELVDDRLPFVDRVDSWATKDPWAFLGSSADKFSFVDRVDDKPSKERFSLRNHSDFIRPIATEEQWKVPNQSSRNEIPSYNRTQPYYPEPMIPKVNSALWESQPYNYMRPEASLAPNNPEGHLAHKDLMPYMRPEVIPAPISSHPYMQPYVFSNSAPSVPGPYSKAMQVQMNSKANETFQGISNKSASGMKRKASYGSSSNIYKKKKLDGGWSCTLCQISATSEKTLDGHFYGRKHKENEEQLREKKTKNEAKHKKGKTVVKEESLNQIKPQVNNDVKSKDGPQSETPRKFFKFWCKHCQFGADTKVQLNDHNKGKRHFLNLQEKSVAEVSTPAP